MNQPSRVEKFIYKAAEAIDAKLHSSPSPARTAIIAETIRKVIEENR